MAELTEQDVDERRLRSCLEAWPEAWSGDYNPSCCRFPKSCSPHASFAAVLAGNLTEEDLEPKKELWTPRDICHNCGGGIFVQIFKNSGFCSALCQEMYEKDHQ